MSNATDGSTVQFHYSCKLDDGTELDSSASRDPLELTLGSGAVLQGVERALIGMAPGETKTVTLTPEEAYGERQPELVQQVERTRIPPNLDLELGTRLQAAGDAGQELDLTVVALDEDTVTLDANHPLAGKELTFELELVGIK